MNIKKVAMMLTIMLITILSASSFYVLTGEAELNQIITVNSTSGIRVVPYHDYEFVYSNETEDPYIDDSSGKRYYIRYTGAESGRTVVDLDDTENGHGYGLTKENGLPTIDGTTLTSTYKMFSKRDGGTNTEITRVLIPSNIAIENDGIAENTFEGYNNNEIDCIYKTGDITRKRTLANRTTISAKTRNARGSGIDGDYDKTKKITQSNVITYVCLDNNNINRQGITGDYSNAYNGQIDNVYISDELEVLDYLFAVDGSWVNGIPNDVPVVTNKYNSNKEINYVLFEGGKSWTNKKSLTFMFCNQAKLNLCNHFSIPNNVISLISTFSCCTGITQFPDNFTIPDGVENIQGAFSGLINLKALPDNFSLPNSVTNISWAFDAAHSLKKMPDNFTIPNSVKEMNHAFAHSYLLTGTFVIPKGVEIIDGCFEFSSINTSSSDNLYGYNTPIVMKYYPSSKANGYTSNVLTQTQTGFVTKVPITNQSDWEKTLDNTNGKNSDDNGINKYYLHYKGTATTVDLNNTSTYPTTSDGYPSILSTRVYSTYKMFNNHQTITRVFVPASIAITSNQMESNMFDGCTTQKAIDCIYHTGNVLTGDTAKNARGEGITDSFDKTGVFSESSNAKAYVYLGNENVKRDSWDYIGVYEYHGAVKNVFISNEIVCPTKFCAAYKMHTATLLNYALIDSGEKWADSNNGLWDLFCNQKNLRLTDNFKLPDRVSNYSDGKVQFGMRSIFMNCSSLDKLPDNFKIPSGVIQAGLLFSGCINLYGTISIDQTVKDEVIDLFYPYQNNGYAGQATSKKADGVNTPIAVKCIRGSYIDLNLIYSQYVTKVYVSSFSLDDGNPVVAVQEATNKIVIEDCTEEISVKVNEVSNQKLTVEDETEYVSVTVNKNVEENKSEDEEVQE